MLNVPISWWTNVDIMFLDQVLRGRVKPGMRVADLGCGNGRNIQPLCHAGVSVWGCDIDPLAVEHCQAMASQSGQSPAQFRHEPIESTTLEEASFQLVMANAVLHFAENQAHFALMVERFFALIAHGGMGFARLATSDHWPYRDNSGGFTYLASIAELHALTKRHGLVVLDPIKTVVVEGLRTMTTWVVQRPE